MEHMVDRQNSKFQTSNSKLKLVRVWIRISLLAAQSQLLTNRSGLLFIIGKTFRFLLFFIFLFTVLSGVKTLAGFNKEQVIFFFLVFNLVDITAQFLFRGVYLFRSSVASGNFDLDLLKPLPSFFRPIFGWTDMLDFITLIPLLSYIIYFSITNSLAGVFSNWILFIFLFFNALIVSFSFHLVVCGVGVLTLEVDHLVWIYRDLTNMARFPTDMYPKGVQYLLTFTIPVVVLITVPAKALLGMLSMQWVIASFIFGLFLLFASYRFWTYALKRYSSASS